MTRMVLCREGDEYSYRDKFKTEVGVSGVRQIIPYIVCVNKATNRIALFQRRHGDSRLLLGYTIGVGGHVETTDNAAPGEPIMEIVYRCALREIKEEIGIRTKTERLSLIPMEINKNATAVDCVHTGIVFIHDTKARQMKKVPKDGELDFVGWKTKEELREYTLESWSQTVLEEML